MGKLLTYNPEVLMGILNNASSIEDLEKEYSISQQYVYNKLYISFKGKCEQFLLDAMRRRYKELCEASNRTVTPKSSTNKNVKEKKAKKSKKVKKVDYDATKDESFESRVFTEAVRDDLGSISEYRYEILIRDREPLQGVLTLDQMQTLHFLYSNQGRNLPTNKTLESFPQFTLNELKKVIRAFNITKCSEPFAPHFIESHSDEELKEFRIRYKGERSANAALRDESKGLQDYIKNQAQQIRDLKDKMNDYKDILSSLNIPEVRVVTSNKPSKVTNRTLILYPSDMHIGCYIRKRSTFYHPYDLEEIKRRIDVMIEPFIGEDFEEVIICNLGDTIDGYNNSTVRGGHFLPQIADGNKEIFRWFMTAMMYMLDSITDNINFESLRYYSVGESNHGGDFEYVAQMALKYVIEGMYNCDVFSAHIYDETYGAFSVYDQNFIISHGKNNSTMLRQLPLTINGNPSAELKLNQILDSKFKMRYANIIKGDLHQSATSFGTRFRYRSVGCMLGSSEHTADNYGDNDAIVDYDIVHNDGRILEGRIKVN